MEWGLIISTPTIMQKCWNYEMCGQMVDDMEYYCPSCEAERLAGFESRPSVPALHGLSDGPGSLVACGIHPDKKQRGQELRHFVQQWEANEGHKWSEKDKRNAKILWDSAAKYDNVKPVDYQVDGHPTHYGGVKKPEPEAQ